MSRWARVGLAGVAVFALLLGALSQTSLEIRKEIVINASPERVWGVIVDFPSYSQWNTQLAWLGGTAGPGEVLKLKLSAEGSEPYEFAPTVSHWEPNVRFAWLARTGLPGVFDGEHFFELRPIDASKTLLVNREVYSGVLSMVMERQPMMQRAPAGFEKMNAEYKARAESR